MEARKYWTLDCIDWKEFYWQCRKFLDSASLDCTQEEFEEYHPCKGNTYDFLESQDVGMCDVENKYIEGIEARCDEIYDKAYTDTVEECREAWGWE